MSCKISYSFYKLVYFRLILSHIYNSSDTHQNQRQSIQVIRWQNYTHKLSTSLLKILRHMKVAKTKKQMMTSLHFFSRRMGYNKVVEWIVMDFGLLILHKRKVLIL